MFRLRPKTRHAMVFLRSHNGRGIVADAARMVVELTRDSDRPNEPQVVTPPLDRVSGATPANDDDKAHDAGYDVEHARTARGVFLGIAICLVGWAAAAVVWRLLR